MQSLKTSGLCAKPTNRSREIAVMFDHHAFTMQRFGGVSRYFCELIRHLPPHGIEPDVFLGLNANDYAKGMLSRFGLGVPPVRHTVTIRKLINRWGQASYLRFRHPQVIHKTGYSYEPVPKAAGIVITIHDMIHESMPSWEPLVRRAKEFWCKRADHIIAISQATCDDLLRIYDVPPAKVTVIHHGASLLPSRGSARPVPEEYVLYVGTRERYKNFPAFAEAWAGTGGACDRYRLVCFGGGPLTSVELAQLHALGIQDRVVMLTGGDTLLASCYEHAEALVCPSLQEGFGLPLLEAMAADCPVVCSAIAPFKEVAGGAALYFDPSSVADMRRLLSRYLNDPSRMLEARAHGLERSRRFSWDRCARQTAEVYRLLADSGI